MEFNKTKENRYRHYKGNIYYKLAEAQILRNTLHPKNNDEVIVGECTYEPTGDILVITQVISTGCYFCHFKDKDKNNKLLTRHPLFAATVIIYQSEEGNLTWCRLKDEWEGFTEVDGEKVKRFTLANA